MSKEDESGPYMKWSMSPLRLTVEMRLVLPYTPPHFSGGAGNLNSEMLATILSLETHFRPKKTHFCRLNPAFQSLVRALWPRDSELGCQKPMYRDCKCSICRPQSSGSLRGLSDNLLHPLCVLNSVHSDFFTNTLVST